MSQILPEDNLLPKTELDKLEKNIEEAVISTSVDLFAGARISLDGYVYFVERANPPLFSIKFKGVDPQEQRPREHRHRQQVGGTIYLAGHKYKILSTSGHIRYLIRLIK